MFKLILIELIKSYVANETPVKKSYSHLYSGFFALIAFILLAFADYYYFYKFLNHESLLQNLLILSTSFFLLAIVIQIFSMWLNRKIKHQTHSVAGALQKLIIEVLPVVVSVAPVGVTGYLIWKRVCSKMGCKNLFVRKN